MSQTSELIFHLCNHPLGIVITYYNHIPQNPYNRWDHYWKMDLSSYVYVCLSYRCKPTVPRYLFPVCHAGHVSHNTGLEREASPPFVSA